MTLEEIYGCVPSICYKDTEGVYIDGTKVALDNTRNTGYIRWDGERKIERIGNQDYHITKPLVFVGNAPNADGANLLYATIAALVGGDTEIHEATLDKWEIAYKEGIPVEELRKFDGIPMVWVRYDFVTIESYCYAPIAPVPVPPCVGIGCMIIETDFIVG